jgi:hypothetical protein
MKKSIGVFILLAIGYCSNAYAQDKIQVPRGKAILIDGKFSAGEWQDAAEKTVSDSVKLYVKTSEHYVFICVRLMAENSFFVDLYLSTSNKEIHNLHASAKLGERLLKENDYPEWQWWNNRDWSANVSRVLSFDERKFLPDEVKEFQISRERFKGNQWLTMFEIYTGGTAKAFPTNTTNKKTENWLLLEFKK